MSRIKHAYEGPIKDWVMYKFIEHPSNWHPIDYTSRSKAAEEANLPAVRGRPLYLSKSYLFSKVPWE